MQKIEYPKMLYHDTLLTDKGQPYLVVQDREEHLIKQRLGYHEHDGKLIEDDSIIAPNPDMVKKRKKNKRHKFSKETKSTRYVCRRCASIWKSMESLRMHNFMKHGIRTTSKGIHPKEAVDPMLDEHNRLVSYPDSMSYKQRLKREAAKAKELQGVDLTLQVNAQLPEFYSETLRKEQDLNGDNSFNDYK